MLSTFLSIRLVPVQTKETVLVLQKVFAFFS